VSPISAITEDLMNLAVSARSLEEVEKLAPGTVSVRVSGLADARAQGLTRVRGLQCVLGHGNATISDVGLGLLCRLENLKVLDLEWCATITDVGLAQVGYLKQLRCLDLSFCRGITTQGGRDDMQACPPGL
jgi:hypothetical protein